MPIIFPLLIFIIARVSLSNPFIIREGEFHIPSYLVSAQIHCVQILPGWFTMQRGLLCSFLPTSRNKWFLSLCINYLATRTTLVTKCKDLQVPGPTLDLKNEYVRLCAAHWKTCLWSAEGRKEQGQRWVLERKKILLPELKKVVSLSRRNKPVISRKQVNCFVMR